MRRQSVALGIVGLVALAGCGKLGPKTIVRDRFSYNAALAESWKNQLLQNVVRIRYADMPIYLEVISVVSQYEIKGKASVRGGILAPVAVSGGYTERPTMSYAPLKGQKFSRSLMTPLPPRAILHLIEVGWPAEFILDLAVQAVNGIYNRAGGALVPHPADPEFTTLLELLASVQQSGVLVLQVEQHEGKEELVLMFRKHPDSKVEAEIASIMQILRLDPDMRRFRVSAGVCSTESNELKFQTRSILMMMYALAMGVEVPSAHSVDTIHDAVPSAGKSAESISHARIRSGKAPPEDPYAAIQYRGHWFWIDNQDVQSKRAFSLIQLLMNLAEGDTVKDAPVLTLPTG